MPPQVEKPPSTSEPVHPLSSPVPREEESGPAESETGRPENPLESAGLTSRMLFLWAYPLVKLGQGRPLDELDLSVLPTVDTSVYQRNLFKRVWEEEQSQSEQTNRNPSLASALFREYWRRSRRARWFLAFGMTAKLVQTLALGRILRLLERDDDNSATVGYLWATLLVACGLCAFPAKQQQFFESYRTGMQFRTCLVATIYSKILRLPSVGTAEAAEKRTTGHVTNLASNDVERFVNTSVSSTYLALGPMEAVVVLVLGMTRSTIGIGPVFGVGYALLCLSIPLQFWLSRRFAKCRRKIAAETDARVGWVSQAVYGARMMKQDGLEDLFAHRIAAQRQREICQLQTSARFKALNDAIYYCTSVVVAAVVFSVYVAIGGTLTPELVYTTLTLLNILQFTLTKHIPNAIMGLSECYVSCKRLQALLELPESPTATRIIPAEADAPQSGCILSLSNVTCYWDYDANNPAYIPTKLALSDISLDFEAGKLYCVIGKMGSSKSALLEAISGEIPFTDGALVQHAASMSYAPQEPWIMEGNVQENILMGLELELDWYDQVIEACALRDDLGQFPNGDKTMVGERGVQCSGGQKARIGLARTIYNRSAALLLLDDPLSAVDAKVAKTIFFSAIQALCVKQGRCVILVTHQHQFAGLADQCILMSEGRVRTRGSFEDCVAESGAAIREVVRIQACDESERTMAGIVSMNKSVMKEPTATDQEEQGERRTIGIVKKETWASYAKAFGGYTVCVAFFSIFVATQAILLVNIVLLGKWGELSTREAQNTSRWYTIVGGMTATLVFFSIFRAQFAFYILIQSARRLHDQMTKSVLRAKISFFDTNPSGRILNRFSADVGIVDETLPLTIYDFLVGAFMFLGSVITAMVILPFVLLVLPPLIWCFLRFRSFFVATTRELKRLEGLARSPIYAMLSETMLGIGTIRVNGSVGFFSGKFDETHDRHSRVAWAFMASSRWFATSLDLLSFILLATATLASVLLHYQGLLRVDSATLGLALTLLIQMANTNFPWMVRQSAEVTNQMVSVERMLEFGSLESEGPLSLSSDDDLDCEWPSRGRIEVSDLSVRYRPYLPLVLNGVNFSIDGNSKVGIVGRTGSGKSTLVQALFRLVEVEQGHITIDGVNIAEVGLHRLRKSISVIPQVPTLFSGFTIRENLDIFGKYSDLEILKALQGAHLKELVDSLPLGVASMVAEGGCNFSVGQRQLLCLARAILSKKRLLVLDETTANIDRRTDQLLQESLNESFQSSTILAVAHRLETIMDSDSVLVMGHGRVLEKGPPKLLLFEGSGHFAEMAKSAWGDSCVGNRYSVD